MLNVLIYDLLIILTAGFVAALVCRRLRISTLVGYLVVGMLIGDGGLHWVDHAQQEIEYIAEGGVFLLLFTIGLEFSLSELWRLRRNLIIAGASQMLLVAAPVALLLSFGGLGWRPTLLIAAAIAFSSTVLVFKALSEWGHASLPHGRRAIGILLFQDAALVPLLLLIPILIGADQSVAFSDYVLLAVTSTLFVLAVGALRHLLANRIIPLFASYRTPELVVLFTLVSLGGVTFAAYSIGLPPAVGAFAAGLIFGDNRWTGQIDSLVLPFRETFAAVFFVSLGMQGDIRFVLNEPIFMLTCLVGLIVIKGMAGACALRLTGLPWRTSLGMGIGLAHVGEFAFVLLLLGAESGVIPADYYRQIAILAIGTLILTPLLLKRGLRWTQANEGDREPAAEPDLHALADSNQRQAVVIGAGPIGRLVSSRLEIAGKDVCLVDLSPINLQPFAQQGFRTVAGEATDPQILARATVHEAAIVVICIPDDEAALHIVRRVKAINKQAFILVRCRFQASVTRMNEAGADRVVSEEAEAGHALENILVNLTIGDY